MDKNDKTISDLMGVVNRLDLTRLQSDLREYSLEELKNMGQVLGVLEIVINQQYMTLANSANDLVYDMKKEIDSWRK